MTCFLWAHGASNLEEAIKVFKKQIKNGSKLIIAWGEKGAAGYDSATQTEYTTPAVSISKVKV